MVKDILDKATQTLSHSTPIALGLTCTILGFAFYCGISFNRMTQNTIINMQQDLILQKHTEQINELKILNATTVEILRRLERKVDGNN